MSSLQDIDLAELDTSGVCDLFNKLIPTAPDKYTQIIKDNEIDGLTLFDTDLDDLRKTLGNMILGHWTKIRKFLEQKRMNATPTSTSTDTMDGNNKTSSLVPNASSSAVLATEDKQQVTEVRVQQKYVDKREAYALKNQINIQDNKIENNTTNIS